MRWKASGSICAPFTTFRTLLTPPDAAWAFITFPLEDIEIADESQLTTYQSSKGFTRRSCKKCGCLVTWQGETAKEADLSYALFSKDQLGNAYRL